MKLEQINYAGWDAYRLTNHMIELVVTQSVGPRIIRFGFVGGDNVFKEYPSMHGLTGGDEWRIYGGHRLWHAPEHPTRTYQPDNAPVTITPIEGGLRTQQAPEAATGIEKQMDITIVGDRQVQVVHRLINRGLWSVRLAAWGLSVMTTGGVGILPIPPRGSHSEDLLPSNNLTLWAYTRMDDPRWTWGENMITLQQDENGDPQKIGISDVNWAGYLRKGVFFYKKVTLQAGAEYPDMNSPIEMFTNNEMLEVESLSPMTDLAPEGVIEHVEDWNLVANIPDARRAVAAVAFDGASPI